MCQGRCEAESCFSFDERNLDQRKVSDCRIGSPIKPVVDPLDHPIVCQALQPAISNACFVGFMPFEDRW
jgi:hypothetical protein